MFHFSPIEKPASLADLVTIGHQVIVDEAMKFYKLGTPSADSESLSLFRSSLPKMLDHDQTLPPELTNACASFVHLLLESDDSKPGEILKWARILCDSRTKHFDSLSQLSACEATQIGTYALLQLKLPREAAENIIILFRLIGKECGDTSIVNLRKDLDSIINSLEHDDKDHLRRCFYSDKGFPSER